MYETLIWATDGSECADVALTEALRLSEVTGARIVAVHCDQRLRGRAAGWPRDADEDDRLARIEEQVEELKADGIDIELVVRHSRHEAGDVVAEAAAELNADAIVCGVSGLSVIAGAILGSVTQRLTHVAPCTVVTVRERTGPRSGTRAPTRAVTST